MVLRLAPVFLSALLLAAHFSRAGRYGLLLLSLGFPFLLLIRLPWAVRLVQLSLVLGGLEWIRTTMSIAGRRIEAGEPWTRMAIILGAVTLLTLASTLVFRSPRLRPIWFGEPRRQPGSPPAPES